MQKRILLISTTLLLMITSQLKAQYTEQDTTYSKFYIGSSLFVLANLVPDDNSPDFYQINLGYRLSPKDAVSLELKTWKYAWPLGIVLGSESFEAPGENFPSHIREFGFALAYHRFFWKGLYGGLHVMSAFQNFVDESGNKIDNGFQIFNTYRAGYHFKLFKDRFFFQPSFAITHRPYHTKMPDSFKQVDDKWGKLNWEPGLHFGYNF